MNLCVRLIQHLLYYVMAIMRRHKLKVWGGYKGKVRSVPVLVGAIRVDLLSLLEDGDLLALVLRLWLVLLELGGGERHGDESGQNNELLEKQKQCYLTFLPCLTHCSSRNNCRDIQLITIMVIVEITWYRIRRFKNGYLTLSRRKGIFKDPRSILDLR